MKLQIYCSRITLQQVGSGFIALDFTIPVLVLQVLTFHIWFHYMTTEVDLLDLELRRGAKNLAG